MGEELGFLASPYSHADHYMMHLRFVEVVGVAAKLSRAGFNFFCPIMHGHPMAEIGGIPKTDHTFWMRANKPWLRICNQLWVVTLGGWEASEGIEDEIAAFALQAKLVAYLRPECPVEDLCNFLGRTPGAT